jgi:hypothetical protein
MRALATGENDPVFHPEKSFFLVQPGAFSACVMSVPAAVFSGSLRIGDLMQA